MGANKEKAKMHTLHRKAFENCILKFQWWFAVTVTIFRVLVMLNMI